MASTERKLGNAVGAKSVRACDNCVRKRARWYCASDDAFLCQSCDTSVHSANPLARRHERVHLKIASIKSLGDEFRDGATCKLHVLAQPRSKLRVSVPTWHQGFTRKARTPRQKKSPKDDDDATATISHPLRLVPEISSEENSHEENEEQLLYRVPIFDPFVAELCTSTNESETTPFHNFRPESKPVQLPGHPHGFLPSETDLAEFAADVESLLGKGLENESFDMEALGILDCDDEREREWSRVKVEDEENREADLEFIGLERESFELNFDYDSPIEEETKMEVINFEDCDKVIDGKIKKICLSLDYDGVLSAWADQKSPWTTGQRPDLNSDGCWPDCMGTCGTMHVHADIGTRGRHTAAMGDGGREARVSRYREKRRTRLFSKKIRYEVRKLNAEKRPRMKGRFVKRANFVAPTTFSLLNK